MRMKRSFEPDAVDREGVAHHVPFRPNARRLQATPWPSTRLVPEGNPAGTRYPAATKEGAHPMRGTDSADRVVAVLDQLAGVPEGVGVTDVARQLGVHKTTASRLLGTLALTGVIERDAATRRYRFGARLVSLAGAAMARLPVVSQARPELEHLAAVATETANLAILDGRHVVYVDQVVPPQAVVMASWVGRRSPAHASSSGKVLLAFGDEAVREAVLSAPLESGSPAPSPIRGVFGSCSKTHGGEAMRAAWANSKRAS